MKTLYIIFLYFLFDRTLSVILHSELLNSVYVLLSKLFAIFVIVEFLGIISKRGGIRYAPLVYVLLIFLSLFISTIVNNGDIRRYLMIIYPVMSLTSFCLLECNTIYKLRLFINAISNFYTLLASVNLLLLLLFPSFFSFEDNAGGIMYFLGGENMVGYSLLFGFYFVALDFYFKRSRMKFIYYLLVYALNIFVIFSGSNVIGFLCLLFLIFPNPIRKVVQSTSLKFLSFVFVILFMVIVLFGFLNTILNMSLFSYIIEDLLGKNITLTNRTIIWSIVISEFFNHPILGHGIADTVNLFYISEQWSKGYFSAHNQVLQSLYEGGILLFISFIPIICWLSNALRSCDVYISNIFKAIFCALLVMFMGEAAGLDKLLTLIVITIPIVSVIKNNNNIYMK